MKDEEKRVKRNHDRTVKPVEGSSHKVQEVGSLENRDDANKFNLAMDDGNIDFNNFGVPNAMVKRSQSISVHDLIQQNDRHFKVISNSIVRLIPSAQSQKNAMMAAGNIETMRDNRRGAEITVQSMPYALEYRNCVLYM